MINLSAETGPPVRLVKLEGVWSFRSSHKPPDGVPALAFLELQRVGIHQPTNNQAIRPEHEPSKIPTFTHILEGYRGSNSNHWMRTSDELFALCVVVAGPGLDENLVIDAGVRPFHIGAQPANTYLHFPPASEPLDKCLERT